MCNPLNYFSLFLFFNFNFLLNIFTSNHTSLKKKDVDCRHRSEDLHCCQFVEE